MVLLSFVQEMKEAKGHRRTNQQFHHDWIGVGVACRAATIILLS
jgi:hypothetical protein